MSLVCSDPQASSGPPAGALEVSGYLLGCRESQVSSHFCRGEGTWVPALPNGSESRASLNTVHPPSPRLGEVGCVKADSSPACWVSLRLCIPNQPQVGPILQGPTLRSKRFNRVLQVGVVLTKPCCCISPVVLGMASESSHPEFQALRSPVLGQVASSCYWTDCLEQDVFMLEALRTYPCIPMSLGFFGLTSIIS